MNGINGSFIISVVGYGASYIWDFLYVASYYYGTSYMWPLTTMWLFICGFLLYGFLYGASAFTTSINAIFFAVGFIHIVVARAYLAGLNLSQIIVQI